MIFISFDVYCFEKVSGCKFPCTLSLSSRSDSRIFAVLIYSWYTAVLQKTAIDGTTSEHFKENSCLDRSCAVRLDRTLECGSHPKG